MNKSERIAYKRGQADAIKIMLGCMVIGAMEALMFGQAFLF